MKLNWKNAKYHTYPFKYVVIDDFIIDRNYAVKLYEHFPPAEKNWYKYDNVFEKKRAQDKINEIPSALANFLLYGNSHIFTNAFEAFFDIKGLIPDPALRGGGLHQIYRGGKLDVHADFNWHQHLNLDRRLNAILYLNYEWQESWNGHLELWDKEMSACQIKLLPIFNRLVVFETTDFSYHGHPEPLKCPPEITRKSMAWYYYTNGRPEHEKSESHSTLFKKRPQDQTNEEIEALREKRNREMV